MDLSRIRLPQLKISKTALFITAGILIFSIYSILAPSSNTNPVPGLVTISSTPVVYQTPGPTKTPVLFALDHVFPSEQNPSIAGTHTAIIFYFNRELTSDEINSLSSSIKPDTQTRRQVDINHKTVYVTPATPWLNGTKYTVNVIFSNPTRVFTAVFTPNSQPPKGNGLGGEEKLNLRPSPAL